MDHTRRSIGVAAASVLATAAAAAAPAAHADTTRVSKSGDYLVRSVDLGPGDGPETTNNISVTQDGDGSFRITEGNDGQTMVAEAPCALVSIRVALCPPDENNDARLVITTGPGADSVSIAALPVRSGLIGTQISGGHGGDFIVGGPENDVIEGDARNGDGSTFTATQVAQLGDGGPDQLLGGPGRDTISGNGGDDYINGRYAGSVGADSANTLDGGPGSDFFDLGDALGADQVIGGANRPPQAIGRLLTTPGLTNDIIADVRGGDTASYGTRTFATIGTAGVNADLDGAADDGASGEGDQIGTDVEALGGTIRDDTLTGSAQDNIIRAELGVDTVRGGSGGADRFFIRDGIRDTCIPAGADDFVDADLQDPAPSSCTSTSFLLRFTTFTFSSKPVDETIPYVGIGSFKRRGDDAVIARLSCPREAVKACTGELRVAKARGGRALGRKRFRLLRGRAAAVALKLPAARVATLRKDGGARVSTVSEGTSDKGPTTTIVQRRLR